MSELIERQAAIDALDKRFDNIPMEQTAEILMLRKDLRELPTIQPEKAQLSSEDATFDLISRTETVERLRITLGATVPIADYDDGYVDGVQFAISTVSTMPTIQPEPAIPVAWIEGKIEWLNNMDNYFAELTANIIKTMLNEWRKGEQNETD